VTGHEFARNAQKVILRGDDGKLYAVPLVMPQFQGGGGRRVVYWQCDPSRAELIEDVQAMPEASTLQEG